MNKDTQEAVKHDIEMASDVLLATLDYINANTNKADPDEALSGIHEAFDRINRTIPKLEELT